MFYLNLGVTYERAIFKWNFKKEHMKLHLGFNWLSLF
jgi:hypothetical protein